MKINFQGQVILYSAFGKKASVFQYFFKESHKTPSKLDKKRYAYDFDNLASITFYS